MTTNLTPELQQVLHSTDFTQMLHAQARRTCGHRAAPTDIELFESDVFQELLRYVEQGVFLQAPRVNRLAQVLHYLGYSVMRVRRRRQKQLSAPRSDEEALQLIAAGDRPVEETMAESELIQEALERIDDLGSPAQRLAVRWGFIPNTLAEDHLSILDGYKAGGHLVLARAWRLAWKLLQDARLRLDDAKVPHGQQPVAEAVSFSVEPADIDEEELERAVNRWQQHQSRALKALRELMEE